MNEDAVRKILFHLKELNEELNVPREKVNALNLYNETFINKILLHDSVLHDDEVEYYNKLKSILEVIEQKKRTSNALLEKEKRKNDLIFEERFNTNKDIYDNELRVITKEMDKLSVEYDKNISSISNASYYKKLDIIQTNAQYDEYLNNIKENYLEKINYFFSIQESKIKEIDIEEEASYSGLNETLEKIEEIFKAEVESIEKEKNEKSFQIQQEKFNKEKILLNQKIELNKNLDCISHEFKDKLAKKVGSFKNHIDYLNEEIVLLNINLKEKENEILDEFKSHLELIDKDIELYKADLNEEEENLKLSNTFNLPKKLLEIENKSVIFNESMRTEKIKYDAIKSAKVKRLYLDYEYNKAIINKKIELTNSKIKTIESINSFEEYLELITTRHEIDLQELAIKNELDNIRQVNYLLEDNDKINVEYYNTIHDYQTQLHNNATSYNTSLYETQRNNIRTLQSLEIEKNLILKNYNIDLNNLLRLKLECASSFIKNEEEIEIKKLRSFNELNKKILSQDIQLANKKNELQKKLILLEKEFFENSIVNIERSKLESQTYRIFEDRFAIEKKLYELYLNDLIQLVELFTSYLTKYNTLTRCSNKNIAISTLDYLIDKLKIALQKSIDKIIKVTTDRINFEGTINFQYELNKLITERDRNDSAFESSSAKMNETIENYKNTIKLFETKVDKLEAEIYKTENTLILRNMEVAKIDSKNSTLIEKTNLEILILKDSIINHKKEQKIYNESILKNKKLIVELEKSLSKHTKKYNKTSSIILNQLETIDKRHKAESSIYYKFIDRVNLLAKSFNVVVDKSEIEESVYKFYKNYSTSLTLNINEFKVNYMDNLINNLYTRHESLLANSIVKGEHRNEETEEIYALEVESACATYNTEIMEIEKKIDKLILTNETNIKEFNINYKEKNSYLKNKERNIDISITQKKAQLLYDIDTFAENIKNHNLLNQNSISQLKLNRKGLSKEYYKHSEVLTQERHSKKLSADIIHNNAVENLKQSYKNLVKEKSLTYKKKYSAYLQQITEYEEMFKAKMIEYDNFISSSKIELNLAHLNLDKALENSLHLIKKRSQNKINKEKKKFKTQNK